MKLRILVDVPRMGLLSGSYIDLHADEAKPLIESGAADPNAPWPADLNTETPADPKPARKKKTEN